MTKPSSAAVFQYFMGILLHDLQNLVSSHLMYRPSGKYCN